MFKEALFQSVVNGVTLLIVGTAAVTTAGLLGPTEFGKFVGLQSMAILLMPLVTLRIETRIANCTSVEQLGKILSAVATSVILFFVLGLLATPALGIYFGWNMVLAVIVLASCIAILETLINGYSYLGQYNRVVTFRTLRQLLPSGVVLASAYYFGDFQLAVAALVLGTFLCVIVSLLPMRHLVAISIKVMCKTIKEYASGLRASFVLGILNAVSLNGLLPLMNVMGLSHIAGQYAVAQWLMNAPLGVVAVAIQSVLLKSGNRLHKEGKSILIKSVFLFLFAILLALALYFGIYIQTAIPFPVKWKLDESLFYAASLFFACSFAVGTVSIISVRLKDEWFVALWQLAFIVIWIITLVIFSSSAAFVYMLFIGGFGYWILVVRWALLSMEKHG